MTISAPRIAAREGIVDAVKAAIGDAFLSGREAVGEVSIDVERERVADVLRTLRDDFEYQQLMDVAGVDYPARPERFDVVYHLLSVTRNHRLRIRVTAGEEQPVPTVTQIYPVAGWLEREVFDLYGVTFTGNPDLRRILTDYGFEGYPMRKEFPLTGYVELRYSEAEKRVVYEPVELPQDFRTFDFLMPWEGPEYRLPGDEKAEPQAVGAPSPAPAPAGPIKVEAKPGGHTPKTTDSPADTGGGAPADAAATRQARKSAAEKAEDEVSKASDVPDPKSTSAKPRRPGGGAG